MTVVSETDTALSWSAMYGVTPTTAMTATTAATFSDLPYLEATKSATEVMFWDLASRMTRSTNG